MANFRTKKTTTVIKVRTEKEGISSLINPEVRIVSAVVGVTVGTRKNLNVGHSIDRSEVLQGIKIRQPKQGILVGLISKRGSRNED